MTSVTKHVHETDEPRPYLAQITISEGGASVDFGDESNAAPMPYYSVVMALGQVQNSLIRSLGEEILEFTAIVAADE